MQDDLREDFPEWLRPLRETEPIADSQPVFAGEPILDELREEARGADLGTERRLPQGGLRGMLQGLAPWQRFVLALLLFLDVALLGCMCLVMTGRVVPFP